MVLQPNFSVIFDFSSIVIGQVKKNKMSTGRKKEKEHKKKKVQEQKEEDRNSQGD